MPKHSIDPVAELARKVRTSGLSERAWAREHGLSESYVRHVLDGTKRPSERILAAIGLHRTETITRAGVAVPTTKEKDR